MTQPAKLALEDGTVYTGTSIGAAGEVDGEVCFNTSMTGYQEILTDPSYRGQIVTMTYPEIGNYGVNREDLESAKPAPGRLRRPAAQPRGQQLPLRRDARGLPGAARRRRHRRHRHAGPGPAHPRARRDERRALDHRSRRRQPGRQRPSKSPGLVGRDLVREVMPAQPRDWNERLHQLAAWK